MDTLLRRPTIAIGKHLRILTMVVTNKPRDRTPVDDESNTMAMKRRTLNDLASPSTILLAVSCAVSLIGVGCGDGAGQETATVAFALTTGEGPVDVVDEDEARLRLVSGQVYLRDIELDLPDGLRCADFADVLEGGARCDSSGSDDSEGSDDDDKIRVSGPFVIDLMTGASTPDLSGVRVPALTYRRIDFRFDDGDPRDGVIAQDHPLNDRTWVSQMTFTHDGEEVTVDIALRFNEDFRVEQPAGIELRGGDELLVLFDPQGWLEGISFGRCIDDGDVDVQDGRLVIDDDSDDCGELEGILKRNLKTSARLGRR
jgi:hypothetical protein